MTMMAVVALLLYPSTNMIFFNETVNNIQERWGSMGELISKTPLIRLNPLITITRRLSKRMASCKVTRVSSLSRNLLDMKSALIF